MAQAAAVQPGHGWIAANVQGASDAPLSLDVSAGKRFTPNWAAFGDVWAQPLNKTFGGDAGVQYKNVDLYAGGWSDLEGHVGGQVGMKYNW